jgi:site-specific recombinase XerD
MLSLGVGVNIEGFRTHSLRATTATNALDHEADIANMQEWLGHANIATMRLYTGAASMSACYEPLLAIP